MLRLRLLIATASLLLLVSCASSDISRHTAANMDMGFHNARNLAETSSSANIADAYQNSTQATKGILLGGAVGAVTGALSTSIGLVPGTAIGAILGGSYGSYIDSRTTLADRLENRGVNIIVLGDQILIVIPSSALFEPLTAYLRPTAYPVLYSVVEYINQYTKMLVKISVYTADTASRLLDESLSQQQANAVAKFLVLSGIDARLLYACGYGGTHLVTQNSSDWNSDNYRIEITLEKLYV